MPNQPADQQADGYAGPSAAVQVFKRRRNLRMFENYFKQTIPFGRVIARAARAPKGQIQESGQ
jgi:hypothetical protein